MNLAMLKVSYKSVPVFLTSLLLAGIVTELWLRPDAQSAEPFHAQVREAAAQMKPVIGPWSSKEMEVQRAAVALLRPNVILQRYYFDEKTGRGATFLLVQCRDARDMAGHYPPVCYRGNGWESVASLPRDWTVQGRVFSGVEYQFSRIEEGQSIGCYVRNLIILPDGSQVRDMDEVRRAAGDFRRHFFGASQVQLVMSEATSAAERDAIFEQIIGGNMSVMEALGSGGVR